MENFYLAGVVLYIIGDIAATAVQKMIVSLACYVFLNF